MPRQTLALLRVIMKCFIWYQRSCLAALACPSVAQKRRGFIGFSL